VRGLRGSLERGSGWEGRREEGLLLDPMGSLSQDLPRKEELMLLEEASRRGLLCPKAETQMPLGSLPACPSVGGKEKETKGRQRKGIYLCPSFKLPKEKGGWFCPSQASALLLSYLSSFS
jgi:hypothetical protein